MILEDSYSLDTRNHTLGCFPLGTGSCGVGLSYITEEEDMYIKYGTGITLYPSLMDYGDSSLISNPTIEDGDVKISIDGSAYTNLTNTPTVSNTDVLVNLTVPEATGKQITIKFRDQTESPQWTDKVLLLKTYGNVNAYVQSDFATVDLTAVTSRLDNPTYGLSAIQTNINDGVVATNMITKEDIRTELDVNSTKLVNLDATISSRASTTDVATIVTKLNGIANEVLLKVVDGTYTVEDILEHMLTYVRGNIQRSNDTFTYYKQDGTTAQFVYNLTDDDRAVS